jgi:phospholipase C
MPREADEPEVGRSGTVDPRQSIYTRREILAGGAGAAAVLLAACGGTTASRAAGVKPAGSDLGAIDHVVMLMQENRSFDHYFGTYRGVRGFGDHPSGDVGTFAQAWPDNTSITPVGRLLPFHLDTARTLAECTFDLSHAWTAQHQCWNHGTMDAFVRTHTMPQYEGPVNGVLTMGYYTRQDLPFYYALADAFTLCDGYHCSVLGPTHPNRVFWMSGTNDPDGRAGGPVIITSDSRSAQWSLSWTTMPERLEDKGVSWKVYNPAGSEYLPSSPDGILISNNILMHFKQYSDPSSALYHKAFQSVFPDDFASDVAGGTLPQVSWIVAPTVPMDHSEHPPAPPSLGEWFTHQVLNTLVSNPRIWAKTVLFVTYDENDGFFDHVAPPTPPPGTPGEYLTVDPLPADSGGISGPTGLGFRVPLLVLSPFSRGGYVVSDTFDHTSHLRFLETRFDVEVPNLSSWRRRTTGDLTATLHWGSSQTSVPPLPATSADDPLVARECQPLQLLETNVPDPPDLVPSSQSMPVQEAGAARRITPRST